MRYAAFFRGINVGGHHIVKMTDLKEMLKDCGFQDVKTYIQSGNAIFTANQQPNRVQATVEQAFADRFLFPCDMALRTADEVHQIVTDLPFTTQEIAKAEASDPNVEHVYVYLAKDRLSQQETDILHSLHDDTDRITIRDRDIYLLCAKSIRLSKLAGSLARMATPFTARNLKTMHKVLQMLNTGS